MSGTVEPVWIENAGRRLFAAWHAGSGTVTSAVLVCPPLLHEAMRSQRLFAQLADALAKAGCHVLRFDYSGTGDSDGRDEDLSLDTARGDAQASLAFLRRRSPGLPVRVLGVRAGAFAAVALAASADVASLWLWQPVVRGDRYLDHLRRLDALERGNPLRYQRPVESLREGSGEVVMGFPCSAAFVDAVSTARIDSTDVDGRDACVLEAEGVPAPLATRHRIDLPIALTAWVDRIDMARTPSAPVEAVARALAAKAGGAR